MNAKTPRNTRTPKKATQTAHPLDQPQPSSYIRLTQAQLDNYLEGDGLFIQCPQGQTVAFVSAIRDEDAGIDPAWLDRLAEARSKVHLLQMLVVRDGHLELNETALMGLATMLAEVQEVMAA